MPFSFMPLPFRKGAPLSLSVAIRPYIDDKYGQQPDMFQQDLDAADQLRKEAINVREAHVNCIVRLQAYAAQLVWLGRKFPLDIGADFAWYPSIGYGKERPVVRNNLKYELANVLFNLAVLYTHLAVGSVESSTEGLKAAASYFSQAAGVLAHVRDEVLPEMRMSDPPEDLVESTLQSLSQVCLAHAQECYWRKAVGDGYRDSSISKLAARVSDLYASAAEAAARGDAISNGWIHFMAAKHNHFAAAAQYRMARDCLERRRYGEEIARLRDAVKCADEGLREMRGPHLDKATFEDLTELRCRVDEDLKRAERDNDHIYMDAVPAKSELAVLDRANMAVPIVPPTVAKPLDYLGDGGKFGPLLFSKLVPFAVHNAVAIYEERRDRLVSQDLVSELEALNTKLHEAISALGLPGSIQALERPLGLPPGLLQHAEEFRQSGGTAALDRSLADLAVLRDTNAAALEGGEVLLRVEEEEDGRLRSRYGTDRWIRPAGSSDPMGSELRAKGTEIRGYLAHSMSSDSLIRDRLTAERPQLELLGGPDRGLMDAVPASRTVELSDEMVSAMGRVRGAFNDAVRLQSRRRKRIEALKEVRRRDDVKPDALREASRLERAFPNTEIRAVHFEDFITKRLDSTYERELGLLEGEREGQERLLEQIKRANSEMEAQRRRGGLAADGRLREVALQRLEAAFAAFRESKHNISLARNFYNDLTKVTHNGFLMLIRQWVEERRAGARALEHELDTIPALSRLTISENSAPVAFHRALAAPTVAPAVSSLAEAQIQSWAGSPAGPSLGTWMPGTAVNFATATSTNNGGGGKDDTNGGTCNTENDSNKHPGRVPGVWNPSAGIKFG